MATVRSVILDLIGRDNASRAFLSAARNAEKAATSFERSGYRMQANGAKMQAYGTKVTKGFTLPLLAVGGAAVKMAADYERSLNTISVATDTSAAQMDILSGGIKNIAVTTGTSLHQLTDGAYTIQKSTHNATQTLQILSAAAKGAKAENADLGVVTNALTSVMASYGLKGDKAVSTTNMLIRGAGLAKTSLQDFASSLSSVVPLASSLGIKLPEVFGAIATMTQHGESPQQAAQNLNSLISSLAGGSNVMVRTLQQLNVPVLDFQKNLGNRGISGTLQLLLDKMHASGKGGMVVYDSFKQAALGASSMDIMLGHLTGQAKKNAEALRSGKLGVGDYRSEAKKMADGQSNMALQFLAAYQSQTGFNDLLKSGRGNTMTYARALLQATGGISNMGAVLKLLGPEFAKTGKASDLYLNSIKSVKKAGEDNTQISGWDKTLKLFTTQWGIFKSTLQVDMVNLGTKLMPTAMTLLNVFKGLFKFIANIGTAIGPSASHFLLLAAAVGPLLAIGGRLLRTFSGVFLAVGRLASYRAGFMGINKGLAQMNTSAYQAGAGMRNISSLARGLGSALSGVVIGGTIGSMIKAGGAKGWIESILGGGVGGAAAGSMFGPLGTAIGGITGMISGGISHWFAHKNAAKEATAAEIAWVNQLTAAIAADNGAIGDGTKAIENQKLLQNGTLKQAKGLGIDTGLTLNAALGQGPAVSSFKEDIDAQVNAAQGKLAKLQKMVSDFTKSNPGKAIPRNLLDATVGPEKALNDRIEALHKLETAILGEAGATKQALALERLGLKTLNDSRLATGDYGQQLAALTKGASEAKNAQGDLTGSLAAGTITGDHNRQVLTNLVAAAKADAAAVFRQARQHLGYKAAVAASQATLADHVVQILAAAKAAHFNASQTADLVMALMNLGKQHPKPTIGINDQATATVREIQASITGLHGKDLTIRIHTENDGGTSQPGAQPGNGHSRHSAQEILSPNARGTSGLPDGWFTVGEQGYELGHKQGSKVQIFSNEQSKKMTGMNRVPGFAKGTKGNAKHKAAQKRSADAINTMIGNIGNTSSPRFDINQVGARLIAKQLRDAWNAVTSSGLPAKTVAKMEAQLRHLRAVFNREMRQLRLKISKSDLTAIRSALKGTVDDARTAFQNMMTDVRHLGEATDRQMKKMNTLGKEFIAGQDTLAKARDYNTNVKSTLSGTFDATQYGSVEDLLTGMGGQTSQNTAYAKELTNLHQRTKGNKGLTAFINKLAASGQTATLETLSGASNAELAQVSRGVGAYNASVSAGGDAATVEQYGATVEKLAQGQDKVARAIEKLAHSIAGEKSVLIDGKKVGKAVAHHVVHSDAMADVVTELHTLVRHGRR